MCGAPPEAEALMNVDAERRLEFLATTFDRETHALGTWSLVFGGSTAVIAAAETTASFALRDYDLRVDAAIAASVATIGSASFWLLPLRISVPLRQARARWSEPDRCSVLANAEATLASADDDERLAHGPLAHVGIVLVNGGALLLAGLGYGHWTTGVLDAVGGIAVGELATLTQPAHLHAARARYDAGDLGPAPSAALTWSIAPRITPTTAGVSLAVLW
ncbi:MAG: hypothetical protein ABI551_05645 [Polyangiaceae bacterium]